MASLPQNKTNKRAPIYSILIFFSPYITDNVSFFKTGFGGISSNLYVAILIKYFMCIKSNNSLNYLKTWTHD